MKMRLYNAIGALLLLWGTAGQAWSEAVSTSDVQIAAETYIRFATAKPRPDAVIVKLEPYIDNSETIAYIAHFADSGFALCGADELVRPVSLYSPSGTFDADDPGLQYFLSEIAERTRYYREGLATSDPNVTRYQSVFDERAQSWTSLAAGTAPVRNQTDGIEAEKTMVELRFPTLWHQGMPYKYYCPILTPGTQERTVVGCVATSTAQLMHYWKWPNVGTGTASIYDHWKYTNDWLEYSLPTNPDITNNARLEWIPDNGGTLRANGYWDSSIRGAYRDKSDSAGFYDAVMALYDAMVPDSQSYSADFSTISYDWDILNYDHTDDDGLDAGDLHAAYLSHTVGIAVGVQYGLLGTTSSITKAGSALQDHFKFHSDAVTVTNSFSSIVNDLRYLRPVLQRGGNEDGGHQWIVLGFNTVSTELKINWGWGGASAWWGADTLLFPDAQWIIKYVAPNTGVKFAVGGSTGDGSPDAPYLDFGEGYGSAPEGSTLIIKAGSEININQSNPELSRPMTLKGYDVVIREDWP